MSDDPLADAQVRNDAALLMAVLKERCDRSPKRMALVSAMLFGMTAAPIVMSAPDRRKAAGHAAGMAVEALHAAWVELDREAA